MLFPNLGYLTGDLRSDTIYAPATGAGRSEICVVRISGPLSYAALEQLAPKARFRERQVKLCTLIEPRSQAPIDRVLITRFMSPKSFTGEDVVELSLTGGRAVVEA